jgi:hypothetical protein
MNKVKVMTQEVMHRLVVETAIPLNFNWIARDMDGSVYAFEKKPNLDYGTNLNPVACDMWDVYEGEVLKVSPKTPVSMAFLTEELGDWRNSLTEITETIGIDNGNE